MKVGDVLARYKPAERLVRVLLDGSIQSEIDEVARRLRKARQEEAGLSSDVPPIEAELEALQERAEESSVTFKVAAVPGKEFDRLKYENPPTEADWQRFKGTADANASLAILGRLSAPEFNFDGFMSKLIGLSVREVDGEEVDWSEDDGVELWDTLHDGARSTLADAVWGVNGETSARPLSETAIGMTSNTDSGSTTPASEESPIPSTLAE